MALSLCFSPLISQPKHRPRIMPFNKPIISSRPKNFKQYLLLSVNCVHENSQNNLPHVAVTSYVNKSRWEEWLLAVAGLYPVYVTVGGVVACLRPSTFSWFVNAAPTSYTLALGFIMLAMGLTLQLKDLFNLFLQRPLSVSFTTLPLFQFRWDKAQVSNKL